MRFAVVIEKAEHNFSGYVPDLPGCITTGQTIEEVERLIAEAIAFHLEGMHADGESIPEPTTVVTTVDVDVPAISSIGKA